MNIPEEGRVFSEYIKELRAMRNVTQEALCEGICKYQEIGYFEDSERVPDIRLQDALLERLGVGAEDFEHYVGFQEYDRWLARQEILHSIIYEQWNEAWKLLEIYRETYGKGNKFENQFILSMQGQVRKYLGADVEELREIYRKAVHLTMPRVEKTPFFEMVLSIKELNLLLEYEQYREGGARQERYLDIIKYLEKNFDRIGRAKLYSKAVYLLCNCNTTLKKKTLLQYCDKAVGYLRDTSRLYYLWEMLKLRDVFIARCIRVSEAKRDIWDENSRWLEALEKVYDEFKVRKETFEYCYLYFSAGIYCINDVIKVRREMLGLSRKELCKDFCEVKTLVAIEERKRVPQRATVIELFKRLGLPVEFKKSMLVTEKQEIKHAMERYAKDVNNLMLEEAEKLYVQIRKQIPLTNRYNAQALLVEEAYLLWNRGELTKTEYCRKVKEALELTIPLKSFLTEGEKYLTHTEQTCIQNLMQGLDKESGELSICLRRFEEYYKTCQEKHILQAEFRMYVFVINLVASELGNRGRYERSNEYDRCIIEGCLRYHRMLGLTYALNDRLWNCTKQNEEGIPVKKVLNEKDELLQIITLSHLGKQETRTKFYRTKLEKILQGE